MKLLEILKKLSIKNLKNLPNISDISKPETPQKEDPKEEKVLTEKELFSFAKFDESKSERLATEPYSYFRSVMRTFIRRPAAIIGITMFVLFMIAIIVIPLVIPYEGLISFDPKVGTFKNESPSLNHLLGTDNVERDLFYAVFVASRFSLGLAVLNSFIVLVLGVVIGLIWGFFRKIDWIMIELYNLISNIPSLLLFMLIASVFINVYPDAPSFLRVTISLTVTGWIGIALFLRNQILIISDREYNIASRTLGTPASRIMIKNLLPFLVSVIVTASMNLVPSMISGEVSLSYFGLGLSENALSLGTLVQLGMKNFQQAPINLIVPGVALAYIVIMFYLCGIAMSDSLDPRTHR